MTSKPPILETERLLLRPYRGSDKAGFVELNTDADLRRHMNGALSAKAATDLFTQVVNDSPRQDSDRWAVVDKLDCAYIGHAFVAIHHPQETPEIGFLFRREYWGRGFATEVAKSLVEYCLGVLRFERVIATVDVGHHPSIRVLEKAGMRFNHEEHDTDGSYLVYSVNDRARNKCPNASSAPPRSR